MSIELLMQNYASRHLPLKEAVFQVLREGILQGEFQAGDRLMEIDLAERLGVSRTPVRESLRALEEEGLVTMVPRKGAVVASITEKQMQDVLEVRRVLEELAVRLAIPRMNDKERELLGYYDELFRTSISKGDVDQIATADEEFHYIIIRGARNKQLLQWIQNCRETIYRYRAAYLADPIHYPHLVEEHHRIYELVMANDQERAARVMYEHIDRQQRVMLELLRNGSVK